MENTAKSKTKKENHKRIVRRRIFFAVLLLLVLTAVGISAYVIMKNNSLQYTGFEVVASVENEAAEGSNYLPYKEGYIRYNRDGAEAVSSKGIKLWNISYNLTDPIAAVCEDCVIIADYNGKTAYITDGTGSVFPITLPYNIMEVEVANQGVAAIRMNDGMQDYIQVVDNTGEVLVDINTKELKDGFPVDMALSNDGTKLITSYVQITNEEPVCWVTFYNFTAVGDNYEKKIVGSFSYETMISKTEFLDNDTACIFLENGFELYKMRELPESLSVAAFDQTVLRMDADDKHIAVVLDYNTNGYQTMTLVFDLTGKQIFQKETAETYEAVCLSGDDILMYNHLTCVIWRLNGEKKINTGFNNEVSRIMPADGQDRFILFRESTIDTIVLTTEEQ